MFILNKTLNTSTNCTFPEIAMVRVSICLFSQITQLFHNPDEPFVQQNGKRMISVTVTKIEMTYQSISPCIFYRCHPSLWLTSSDCSICIPVSKCSTALTIDCHWYGEMLLLARDASKGHIQATDCEMIHKQYVV